MKKRIPSLKMIYQPHKYKINFLQYGVKILDALHTNKITVKFTHILAKAEAERRDDGHKNRTFVSFFFKTHFSYNSKIVFYFYF